MEYIKYPPYYGLVGYWRDWVEEATNGRLVIDIAPPGTYFPIPQAFESIKQGVIDYCGVYFALMHTGIMPEANVEFGLPMAWQQGHFVWDAFIHRGLREEFEALYAEHNLKWFPNVTESSYNIWTNFDPSTVDSLKGKKIRAFGVFGEFWKNLGATPAAIPVNEVHMAMKLGTVDGAQVGLGAIADMQIDEVAKYYLYAPNTNCALSCMIINMDSWNALPDDIKEILDRDTFAIQFGMEARNMHICGELLRARAEKESGSIMVSWSDEDTARARTAAYASWDTVAAASANTKRLVDIVKQQQRDFGWLE